MLEIKITIEAGESLNRLVDRFFSGSSKPASSINELDRVGLQRLAEQDAAIHALDVAMREQVHASKTETTAQEKIAIQSIEQSAAEVAPDVPAAAETVTASPVTASTATPEPAPVAQPEPAPSVEPAADRGKGAKGQELAALTSAFIAEVCQKAERATLNKNLRVACDKRGIAIATVPSLLQAVGYAEAMRLCIGG